jgi:hypothetical protein
MPATITQFARAWFEKHVTGTPEANARLEAAERHLEDHASVDGAVWFDEEFVRRNNAVREAQKDVPWPRRGGWI